ALQLSAKENASNPKANFFIILSFPWSRLKLTLPSAVAEASLARSALRKPSVAWPGYAIFP
ncbi:hypothetical protein, partial [Microbulbifer rhizosphaerae]|uniref:hypothetical protein n=1 Tax=Microbulbifer rhizosphaerae TaxID=1562603 RepID=UPI001C8618FF